MTAKIKIFGLVAIITITMGVMIAINKPASGASGWRQVLVEFQTYDEIPESREDLKMRRQSIEQEREDLLMRIATDMHVQIVRRYDNLPIVALQVDNIGMARLTQDSQILEISEDRVLATSDYVNPFETIGGGWQDNTAAHSDGQDRYGGNDYEIVIIDTGVDQNHPALSGKIVAEACFGENTIYSNARVDSLCPDAATESTAPGSGAACAMSGCDHGTMVAGAAAMTQSTATSSGQYVNLAGAAPMAKIISIMVMAKISNAVDICGASSCARPTLSLVYSGLDHVIDLAEARDRLAAVNISIGNGAYESVDACKANSDYNSFFTAIETLKNLGIATVIATGNGYSSSNSGKIAYPACVENAIAVSATDNGGTTVASYAQNGPMTNFLAPGGSMLLPNLGSTNFASSSGTSFATPIVAGAYAVLRSKFPGATIDELTDKLKNTSIEIADSRNGATKPLVNIASALKSEDGAITTEIDLIQAIARGTTIKNLIDGVSTQYRTTFQLADGNLYYDRGPTPYRTAIAIADPNKLVGTGMRVQLTSTGISGPIVKGDYELIVKADIDGDGRIGLSDLVKLSRHFAEIETLTGAKLKAADLNNTGSVSLTALVKISRHLAEIEEIK